MGNCVYHSACCETLYVTSTALGELTGSYGRIYVEHLPYVVYKKLYTEGDSTNRYIHYHTGQAAWVISDKYWTENNQEVFVYSQDTIYDCPNQMRFFIRYF